jgi:hypothetical protein
VPGRTAQVVVAALRTGRRELVEEQRSAFVHVARLVVQADRVRDRVVARERLGDVTEHRRRHRRRDWCGIR